MSGLMDQAEALLLRSLPDGMIATDLFEQVTFMNPVAEQLTGWPRAEAERRPLGEVFRIVREDTGELEESPVSRLLRDGNPVPSASKLVLITRDGRELGIDHSANPIRDVDGRPVGAVLVFRDISGKRRAERKRDSLLELEQEARREAERLNRVRDEFLAVVSHELRTPLTAIAGWSELLKSGPWDEERVRKGLEIIARNARSQTQLIDDILDVSRIIAGKVRVTRKPVLVRSVIEAALDTVRPVAETKDIHVEVTIAPDVDTLLGDEARLQQVVWNLLSNAVKFTPKGGRVDVGVEQVENHVVVSVTDTGQGISPAFLPVIFDRFRQADSSAARAQKGLGLGLAIVRYLVDLHAGTAHAESEGEGRGSKFVVRIPIRAAIPNGVGDEADSERLPAPLPFSAGGALLQGLRTLVVDDEPDARELLALILEQHGAKVIVVGSAAAAIDVLSCAVPDVLICDIGMPHEDGYAFVRRLREQGEPLDRLPAIALTAYARLEDRHRALAAGFQLHLPKPIDSTELVASIVRVLKSRRELASL
jgi:PAS domain S-box-containing protein